MRGYSKLILIIIIISILLRLLFLDHTIAFDEYTLMQAFENHNHFGLEYSTMPPMVTWVRVIISWFLGTSMPAMRLAFILFGLLSLILTYYLAKSIYDKKVATWAIILMGFSAWHIFGTTSLSYDGAFLTFFYILTIFCYVQYGKFESRKWLYLTGISFGLAMLTKYNAILILFIIGIYALFCKKSYFSIIKEFAIILLLSLIVFSIYPILAYFSEISYFIVTLHHNAVFFENNLNLILLAVQYVFAFIWIGPILIGLYFMRGFYFKKQDLLMHIWIAVVIIFFTFIIRDNFRPLERYFMVFLPAVCILGGAYLSKFKFNKKHLAIFLITFLLFIGFLIFLNLHGGRFLPFYPKTAFVSAVLNLDWNFYMPFTADQGPTGMYLIFSGLAYSILLSIICFLLHFIFARLNKRKVSSIFLVLFLAIAFSYNIFMVQELIFNSTNPDIDQISKDVYSYAVKNDLKQPLFLFRNYAGKYYLEEKYSEITVIDFEIENHEDQIRQILGAKSHVIIIDFPTLDKKSLFWSELSNKCILQKQFEDKGVILGFIFDCSSYLNPLNLS